ncbi:MAG: UxaA family hydrolase [Megasphaera sp.]|jgi:altronate dehydratase small subunit|nr:UxaA family hydrolase [Megasphaera sp.]
MSEKKAIHMKEKDNVAMVLEPVTAGDVVCVIRENKAVGRIVAKDDIAQYHKIALTVFKSGDIIYKYGEVIGKAVQSIETGEHVHVHNIQGVAITDAH